VTPVKRQTVTVYATGWLVSGSRQFWCTRDKYGERPFKWVVSSGSQPEGFDRAVQSMRVGEKATFTISPTFAYGVAGEAKFALPVPGNAPIRVEFKLIKIEETPERK